MNKNINKNINKKFLISKIISYISLEIICKITTILLIIYINTIIAINCDNMVDVDSTSSTDKEKIRVEKELNTSSVEEIEEIEKKEAKKEAKKEEESYNYTTLIGLALFVGVILLHLYLNSSSTAIDPDIAVNIGSNKVVNKNIPGFESLLDKSPAPEGVINRYTVLNSSVPEVLIDNASNSNVDLAKKVAELTESLQKSEYRIQELTNQVNEIYGVELSPEESYKALSERYKSLLDQHNRMSDELREVSFNADMNANCIDTIYSKHPETRQDLIRFHVQTSKYNWKR
jgi:hypothetical protein